MEIEGRQEGNFEERRFGREKGKDLERKKTICLIWKWRGCPRYEKGPATGAYSRTKQKSQGGELLITHAVNYGGGGRSSLHTEVSFQKMACRLGERAKVTPFQGRKGCSKGGLSSGGKRRLSGWWEKGGGTKRDYTSNIEKRIVACGEEGFRKVEGQKTK